MIDIGEKGVFRVHKPFVMDDYVYEVTSKSTITSLLSTGIDVFTVVYEPAYYTKAQYNSDIRDNPVILTLSLPNGDNRFIPENMVIRVDHSEWIEYAQKAIVVNMGVHSRQKSFQIVQDRITQVVKDVEGIGATTSTHEVSLVEHKTIEEHKAIVARRREITTSLDNATVRLRDAHDTILELRSQLRAMVQFVTLYLGDCCDSQVCWQFEDADDKGKLLYEYTLDEYADGVTNADNVFIGESNVFMSHLRHWQPTRIE